MEKIGNFLTKHKTLRNATIGSLLYLMPSISNSQDIKPISEMDFNTQKIEQNALDTYQDFLKKQNSKFQIFVNSEKENFEIYLKTEKENFETFVDEENKNKCFIGHLLDWYILDTRPSLFNFSSTSKYPNILEKNTELVNGKKHKNNSDVHCNMWNVANICYRGGK